MCEHPWHSAAVVMRKPEHRTGDCNADPSFSTMPTETPVCSTFASPRRSPKRQSSIHGAAEERSGAGGDAEDKPAGVAPTLKSKGPLGHNAYEISLFKVMK